MLTLPQTVQIFIHLAPVDLRKGFDGLAAIVQNDFGQDPLSGHLFLFLNRRRDRLKLLYWDRDGLAIWYKRLETGSFQLPESNSQAPALEVDSTQLALVLSGIDLASAKRRKRYRLGAP